MHAQFSKDDHLGDVKVSLEAIRETGSHTYTETLTGTSIACGSVRFSVTWLAKGAVSFKTEDTVADDEEFKAQAQAHKEKATQQAAGPDVGVMHVKVQSAEGLTSAGAGGKKVNPYVVVHYGVRLRDTLGTVRAEKCEKETRVEIGAQHPIWNQTLDLYGALSDIKKDGLLLKIVNKEVLSHVGNVTSNAVLGEGRTWLAELNSVQDERSAAHAQAKQALLVGKKVPKDVVERASNALTSLDFPSMTHPISKLPDEAADEACALESLEYRAAWLAMRKAEWQACSAYIRVKGKRKQRHEYALDLDGLSGAPQAGGAGGKKVGPKLFLVVEWVPEGCL